MAYWSPACFDHCHCHCRLYCRQHGHSRDRHQFAGAEDCKLIYLLLDEGQVLYGQGNAVHSLNLMKRLSTKHKDQMPRLRVIMTSKPLWNMWRTPTDVSLSRASLSCTFHTASLCTCRLRAEEDESHLHSSIVRAPNTRSQEGISSHGINWDRCEVAEACCSVKIQPSSKKQMEGLLFQMLAM